MRARTPANLGALPHDFSIHAKKTRLLASLWLSVRFARAGKFTFPCTVTGYAAAGMTGTLTVTERACPTWLCETRRRSTR